jgi:hypothetical protein
MLFGLFEQKVGLFRFTADGQFEPRKVRESAAPAAVKVRNGWTSAAPRRAAPRGRHGRCPNVRQERWEQNFLGANFEGG